MTQEDKQLLLKDLCCRLPYGVIVRHADYLIDSDGNYTGQFWYKRGYLYNICRLDIMTTTIIESEGSDEEGYEHICSLERTLPYLRPMFSKTEEEKEELMSILLAAAKSDRPFGLDTDWLNAHHFDYRNLIERGLALKAPEDMYKMEE